VGCGEIEDYGTTYITGAVNDLGNFFEWFTPGALNSFGITPKLSGTEHEGLWNKSRGEIQSTKGVGSQLCEKERNN
jgi:hypothetical protein